MNNFQKPEYVKYDEVGHQALRWMRRYKFEIKFRIFMLINWSAVFWLSFLGESHEYSNMFRAFFLFLITFNLYKAIVFTIKYRKEKKIASTKK